MKKNGAFRRAAALMAALSITVSLAAPAFAGTYYIDNGDITITKKDDGSQEIKQNGTIIENDDRGEIVITTSNADKTTLESDLEGPAAEDSGFGPVVEDNYQPAQPEDAEKPEDADQPESIEEPKSADRQESADQQPQQAAPAAAPAPANGFCKNIITVINNFANTALKLTLKDVKIDMSTPGEEGSGVAGKAALSVQGDGNVEIELDGDNELKSGNHKAGLEKNTSEGTLTLKDDNKNGSLKATGGESGAGIGGSIDYGTNNIIITGGTVEAKGGLYAAGIGGSGGGTTSLAENITITGGKVTAQGGSQGAGIGGGSNGNGKNITITEGAEVTATGGDQSAGIGGGGTNGEGLNINITGGKVTAQGGPQGAGIGGGIFGNAEGITISGAEVNATGGDNGAGIGGGFMGNGKKITITGDKVTATGGVGGAGIGGGEEANGEDITIGGGTVNAAGGLGGAGIGGGNQGKGSNVTVSGAAQVTATAGMSGRVQYDAYTYYDYGAGATIGNGGNIPGDESASGKEIQADISGLTTGFIHHIIPKPDDPDSILKEWWEYGPRQSDPNAPTEESNEVSLGTPVLHVETLEGSLLPFDAQQQGNTLRVTSNTLAARLHGTRQALEALREQGVEQIEFVTSLKTTTLPVAELLAEGGSWFALEHDGLVSQRLSAAQAESLKCRMH